MKKKILLFALTGIAYFSFDNFKSDPDNKYYPGANVLTIDSKKLDANNISAWFRNNGSINRDPATGNSGFEWPKGSFLTARYASGMWIGCISGVDTLTAVAEYAYDYQPGYVDNSGMPQGNTDPLYRVYSVTRGDTTSSDYLNWPVNQGAYTTASGKPFFLGTQTMFFSYTDAYPHQATNSSVLSLKAQILQTNWCYTNIGMGDVEFIEFKIINRSNIIWTNTFFSFWTDDDLGTATDDKVGCDTNRNLGFTYNATNNDGLYGIAPPAVGTKLVRSPIVHSGNNSDTIKYYNPPGSQNLITKIGYKFTGMNVFNYYNGGAPEPADPGTNVQSYRVLQGLWRSGNQWINPVTNQPTTLTYTGDPVTETGWNMTYPNDKRFLIGCGPISMSPGDTQSIIFAQVIARGSSNLNSITRLRTLSDYVQTIYDNNFQSVLAVNNISTEIPAEFTLSQNYPNPFNPSTHLKFGISKSGFVSLKVYDVLGNEVKTLVNENKSAGTYEVEFDGSNLSSGIYFYKLTAESYTDTKKMTLLK